jgi:hypothetical protein
MSLMKVDGVLDFALTGIISRITTALAEAGVSVFAIATYDTDYLLVSTVAMERAVAALQASLIRVVREDA